MSRRPTADRARLVVSCPDGPGIVAAISQFLFDHGANIIHSDQHTTDPAGGEFFMRVEFDMAGIDAALGLLELDFAAVAQRYMMWRQFTLAGRPKRIAVFVSREDHCLLELLWQQRSGDLMANVALVISNHPDLRPVVEPFGIPFHHVPMTPETKPQAEQTQLGLLQGQVDVVVLARYMQIISADFIAGWAGRIINIHHSFLPAFVGAGPYGQAHERGVKLIGATAHYVTAELDAGPIIEQDVQRVHHGYGVEDLRRIGRQIERTVLARAVTWHAEDRVLVNGNKTIVFT